METVTELQPLQIEPSRRYDVMFLDITDDNKVAVTIIEGEEEKSLVLDHPEILAKATELKTKKIIGDGKTLPVTIVTFGTSSEDLKMKFYSFPGMI